MHGHMTLQLYTFNYRMIKLTIASCRPVLHYQQIHYRRKFDKHLRIFEYADKWNSVLQFGLVLWPRM